MTYPLMSVSTILLMTKRGVRAAASRLDPEMVAFLAMVVFVPALEAVAVANLHDVLPLCGLGGCT